MNTDDWEDVLTLMTMVILADERIYKEEVDAFVRAVFELNNAISPDIFITESMAFEWFKNNRDRIRDILKSPDSEPRVQALIRRMNKLRHKAKILAAMDTIAHADSDYHQKEHSVIRMSADNWGVPYPS